MVSFYCSCFTFFPKLIFCSLLSFQFIALVSALFKPNLVFLVCFFFLIHPLCLDFCSFWNKMIFGVHTSLTFLQLSPHPCQTMTEISSFCQFCAPPPEKWSCCKHRTWNYSCAVSFVFMRLHVFFPTWQAYTSLCWFPHFTSMQLSIVTCP